MKLIVSTFLVLFSILASAGTYIAEFPMGPLDSITPGKLCERPAEYRYPERIPYCARDVDPRLKADVFREYRNQGYRLDPKDRKSYKIDHLIPLCAGGSNDETNLWPQHVTIYEQTDRMEALGCEKLKEGKILQADLVELIITTKKNLTLVPQTMSYLNNL